MCDFLECSSCSSDEETDKMKKRSLQIEVVSLYHLISPHMKCLVLLSSSS